MSVHREEGDAIGKLLANPSPHRTSALDLTQSTLAGRTSHEGEMCLCWLNDHNIFSAFLGEGGGGLLPISIILCGEFILVELHTDPIKL